MLIYLIILYESSSIHLYSALTLSEKKLAVRPPIGVKGEDVDQRHFMTISQAIEDMCAELHRLYAELKRLYVICIHKSQRLCSVESYKSAQFQLGFVLSLAKL